MQRYYDFAVRYGDLLFDREAVDVTKTHLGGVNEELKVDALIPVEVTPTPALSGRARSASAAAC